MKVTGVITTLEEANKIIDGIRERRIPGIMGMAPFRQEYYRGQLSDEWHVKPNIARPFTTAAEIQDAETKIMAAFQDEIKASGQLQKVFLHNEPIAHQNEWAWVCQAQHYRVPTRLLDWTLRPEVALYFAVDTKEFDKVDGQFWVIYVPDENLLTDGGEGSNYYHRHISDVNDMIFINPSFYYEQGWETAIAEVRRGRQHGKFSLQPSAL